MLYFWWCGEGVLRPVAREAPGGSAKLRFFFGHKMDPKCCYFGRVRRRALGGYLGSKSFLVQRSTFGAPHPPRINHGYRPGGKTAQLAISTAAILKEGVIAGWKIQSTTSQWNGPFVFVFVFVCLFLFF